MAVSKKTAIKALYESGKLVGYHVKIKADGHKAEWRKVRQLVDEPFAIKSLGTGRFTVDEPYQNLHFWHISDCIDYRKEEAKK